MPRGKERPDFTPDPDQMALWPDVSGNAVNGLGETGPRRPSPVYWHEQPEKIPHGVMQKWFYRRNANEAMDAMRAERQTIIDAPLSGIAANVVHRPPGEWASAVKQAGAKNHADMTGVARTRPEWVFEGEEARGEFIIMLGVGMNYEEMSEAPKLRAGVEVLRQYTRAAKAAKGLANWIRAQGHWAEPLTGPMKGKVVMIPPAIACGFGELGKHGSIINRRFGSNFRLSAVLTDLPLTPDAPDEFGADGFCTHCRVCSDACPPDAIYETKQTVRGERKWYVDFDKCLPYFNETYGCGVCIAVCPWSRPGVADNLLVKLARRKLRT